MSTNGLIELLCGDCIVRVHAEAREDSWPGSVQVEVVSNQISRWQAGLWNRLKNAWKVLRGRYDWSGFEVYTPEEAHAIIEALEAATIEAFPEK